jgi:alkanesulfonate monooxygenase SsuD/methylene tetrahydromethanopterin reductase-like flavin-dependent oxidoreductase (luciferase family)
MKVSFFETGRYAVPPEFPRTWPVPSAAYDTEIGVKAYAAIIERLKFVEELGFDWVSVSEHHYSPRILTPSPVVSAAFMAAHATKIKVALLGPIVPTSNPIRVAEELAMLDTMAPGKIVAGMLRGTTNEYLSYDLNPTEARERTDEGMELILNAWREPQPFGWQGKYFQYRTISLWPRPHPGMPIYSLGTSAESGEFAARHHVGLGLSYGNLDSMAKASAYYRKACEGYGWQPGRDSIVYRCNMILGETDEAADLALERRSKQAPFPLADTIRDALFSQDVRNIAGERRAAPMGGVLPITFCGGPERIAKQIKEWRDEVGAGVLDISLQDPGSGNTEVMMDALDLFGRQVLPRIREI